MADAIQAGGVFVVHRSPAGATVALQGVTLDVPAGQVLAIVGPSGSGKTTLLRCLAGLQRPIAGELRVLGRALHRASGRALARHRHEGVGFVGQHAVAATGGDLRLGDAVALRARLHGVPHREAQGRAAALLGEAGLGDRREDRVDALSGGQQRLAAVCRALVTRPALLLADEPTAGLDPATARALMARLRALAADGGATVVVVSHDPGVERHVERTVTMRDGRVAGELEGGELLAAVDPDGVVRLDLGDLEAAGIRSRARLVRRPGELALRTVGDPPSSAVAEDAGTAIPPPGAIRLGAQAARRSFRGRTAVREVSLALRAARFYALAGPSGSGKTTLLELLAGLREPDGGQVTLAGHPLTGLDADARAVLRRDHLAYVAQADDLVPYLDAVENLVLAAALRGRRVEPATARAELVELGLDDALRVPVQHLSGGERQRVALARGLVAAMPVLIADEPTAHLDQRNARRVARRLRRAAHVEGALVLCATHDDAVTTAADERLLLREGQLIPPAGPVPAEAEDTMVSDAERREAEGHGR